MRSSPESRPEEPEALAAREPGSTQQSAQSAHLANERRRIERLSRVRQLVFGSLDGLLVPLGVISGVAAGTNNTTAVVVAGVAEAFAGALSMGAGEFISSRSEAQTQRTQIEQELRRVRSQPAEEFREMVEMFQRDGVEEQDANTIATILARHPNAFETTMVEKELGLQVEPRTVQFPEALTMGSSYIVGSIFPLVPYFFLPVAQALPISIGLTAIALVVVGLIKGKMAGLNLLWSALEVVGVGAVSAGGGYLLGTIIPPLFGY
jgi:vacuolar iron transporter family protein